MRGRIDSQDEISHVFHLDDLVPNNHPLCSIKKRADGITPHVPMGERVIRGDSISFGARRNAWRRRRTRGYEISQRIRKRIEEIIGWCRDAGGPARARFVGR